VLDLDSLNLAGRTPGTLPFNTARDAVVKHHQWMPATDFLPRIVEPAVVTDVFTGGRGFFDVPSGYDDPGWYPVYAAPRNQVTGQPCRILRKAELSGRRAQAAGSWPEVSTVRDPAWRPSLGPGAKRPEMKGLGSERGLATPSPDGKGEKSRPLRRRSCRLNLKQR
jgi:hypothetical protein